MIENTKDLNIPAEWSRQKFIWTAWPSHEELWQEDLDGARSEVAAMVQVLAKDQLVKVLANGDAAVVSADAAIGKFAEVIPAKFGDIWLRDTGPIFATSAGKAIALRFRNNGWGGKYTLPGDDSVGDSVVEIAGHRLSRFDFVLEGGALEHNGCGWILTTRQCLLNPNRNASWTQTHAEAALQRAFNCSRILWLESGLLNDHTDGHIDNLVRFVDRDTVVCQSPSGTDDPNAQRYEIIARELKEMGLTVHHIPSPGRIDDEDGEPMPASHMNFIIGNQSVVVPVYEQHFSKLAVSGLQTLFKDRQVVGLPSRHLLTGGGSFHCITQQEPEL